MAHTTLLEISYCGSYVLFQLYALGFIKLAENAGEMPYSKIKNKEVSSVFFFFLSTLEVDICPLIKVTEVAGCSWKMKLY